MIRPALLPALAIAALLPAPVEVPVPATPSDTRVAAVAAFATVPDPFEHLPWNPTGAHARSTFGRAVAPAGDVNGDGYGDVLVGAPGDSVTLRTEGRAHLFLGSANGLSSVPAWSVAGGQAFAAAGSRVAPAGDVNGDGYADVLVGIPNWDEDGQTDPGRVLVFHGGPGGLPASPNRVLVSPSPNVEQFFGQALDTAGDVNGDGYADVIVGGPSYHVGGPPIRGAAWIWHGSPSGLPAAPATTLIGRPEDGFFGGAVSHAGDVDGDGYADVIIGAPGEDGPFVDAGAVSFHRGSPGGILVVADTTLYGMSAGANFGSSVTGLGDYVPDGYADFAVGAPGATFDGQPAQSGMVRRFYGGPQGVASGDVTLGPFLVANERFGTAVATMGDVNGDGRPDYAASGTNAPLGNGRISLVLGDGDEGLYGPTAYLPPGAGIEWGIAISTSGDVDGDGVSEMVFGAGYADVGANAQAGRAYLYAMLPPTPVAVFGWPRTGPQPGTNYGQSLAVLPAFIGSAAAIAIGDPGFDGGGRVSLHLASGQRSLPTVESFHFAASAGSFWNLGARVVDAGDVNRDGATDLVFSSPTLDFVNPIKSGTLAGGAASQAGWVQVVLGGPDAVLNPMTVVGGESDFDRVGSALAGRGDVNGDGYHDLLVGAAGWDAPGITNAGRIWVFFGGPTGFSSAHWKVTGTTPGEGLGHSVAFGDLDADGYSDVIAGSVHPELEPSSGRVRVWYGGAGGPAANPGISLGGQPPSITYGWAVAALGDVSGDGICDLGVGAPDEDGVGRVYVYAGTRGRSPSSIPIWWAKGSAPGSRFGEALAGGGDLNGDGLADFAIGVPSSDGPEVDEGQVRIHHGAPLVPGALPAAIFSSGINGARMGASFAPFADFNSDGFADLVVGAPGAAGRVYVYFGNGLPGDRRRLRIREIVNGELQYARFHPSRLGLPNEAQAQLPLVFPAGRTRIQAEFEIRLQNAAFTGVPTSRDPSFLVPGPAASLPSADVDLPSFLPGRGYHLRSRFVSRSPYFQRTRWTAPEAHASGGPDFWTSGAVVGVEPPAATGTAPGPRIARVAPNPGGPSRSAETRIDFALPAAGPLSIDLYAVNGARVRCLYQGPAPAGPGTIAWNGRDEAGARVPPGVYFVELRAAGRSDRAKLVRLP